MTAPTPASADRVTPAEKVTLAIAALLSIGVVALEMSGAGDIAIFMTSAVTLMLLAWLLGHATEQLGEHLGGRVAGFLNATLGNVPELVLVVLLIREAAHEPALIEVAKASLIGSVLGNVLFVLGMAFLLGGLRHGTQIFRKSFANLNSTMLIVALAAIAVPKLTDYQGDEGAHHLRGLSIAIAIVLFVVYLASTFYFLKDSDEEHAPSAAEDETSHWSVFMSLGVLAAAALGVAVVSEALVGSMEHTITELGISPSFMGFIIVPIIGNIAEHLVAVQLAWRNQMDFAVTIALGSSVQVALLVVPLAVLFSHLVGNPIDLTFETRQLLAIGLSALIVPALVSDGESTWIEGLQLLALYSVIAIGFWY